MNKDYKNKRDLYKAQAEQNLRRAEAAELRLNTLLKKKEAEEKDKAKWYDETIYCSNCQRVEEVIVPPRVALINSACSFCRVASSPLNRTIFPVKSYPGKRTI